MNLDNERKAFEAWAYSNKWNIFRVRDMGIDKYVDDFVDGAWHGWLASANREGYKLVPLEATQEMVDAVYNSTLDSDDLEGIYKAMIGACDN